MDPPPPSAPPNTTTTTTTPSPDPSAKLRLMVSYGGHIVPRPHDKSLCYIGGDTRIVVVPRHRLTLPDLISRLSNNINANSIDSFVVKYQLPNEDLDSLISVSTDEDLENLIDEYDRLVASSKPSRLRLFLFPAKVKGSAVLDGNAVRSAEWFLGEVNGGRGEAGLRRGFSDPNSVNCLLGLEDGGGGGDLKGQEGEVKRGSGEGKLTVNSVPGSPIVETATSSSFGSSNSSPSLANLAPIRTHVEGGGVGGERVRVSDQRIGEIDEQFSQLNVNVSKHDEDLVVMPSTVVTPVAVTGDVAVGVAAASPGASGVGGNVNRVVSDDERSDQDVAVGFRKSSGTEDHPVMMSSQSQQKLNGGYDLPSPDSVSSDGSHSSAPSRQKQMIFQEPSGQVPSLGSRITANFIDSKVGIVSDPSITAQVQQNSDSSNTPSTQYDLQHQLIQQLQFVHAAPHYVQHPPPGAASYSAYYPQYASQHPQFTHHPGPYPLYYIPAGPAQPYGLPVQQSNFADSANTVPASRPQTPSMISTSAMYSTTRNLPTQKSEMATGIYRTAAGAAAPPLVQVGTGPQQQFVGYPQMHPPAQSITPAPFEYADPAHTQMYFSQPLQPALAAQYQTLTSDSAVLSPDVSAPIPPDNVKQQIKSSQTV